MTVTPEESASISESAGRVLRVSNSVLEISRQLNELAVATRSYELIIATKDADLKKALNALEFYADLDNHKPRGAQPSQVSEHSGRRAREILADSEA